MTSTAIKISTNGNGEAQSLRFPVLPGRQAPEAANVDTQCDEYKAGYAAAASDFGRQVEDLHGEHDGFANGVSALLTEMDERYRQEYFALVKKLFTAVAPTLARHAVIVELLRLVEERAPQGNGALELRVHPDLIAYLPAQSQKMLSENPSVNLRTDETCSPTSIDARWAKGGLVNDPDTLIEEILNVLGRDDAPGEE